MTNPIVRNILAILIGIAFGSILNMGLIMISGFVIPPPVNADVTSIQGLKESIHLFEPKHFIMPFLAHAVGSLSGAFICAIIAKTHKMKFALAIGIFFLAGGISNLILLPSPIWFSILDISLAYIPMSWLGGKLATKNY